MSADNLAYLRDIEHAPMEVVAATRRTVTANSLLVQMLESMPDYVMLLNQERQILALNTNLVTTLGLKSPETLIGKRPGEAFGCIFAGEGRDGCGTGEHCTTCGAARSILETLHFDSQTSHECRITVDRNDGNSFDLRVLSTPITCDGEKYLVCSLRDIAAEKRREVLERVFFHDVINTAGGLRGLAELLFHGDDLAPHDERNFKKMMMELSETLIEEIKQQRELLAAERGDFKTSLVHLSIPQLMEKLFALYVNHDCAAGRTLVLGAVPECLVISDDRVLLRILGNLLKNALEATPVGSEIVFAATETEDVVTFAIRNPGVMPHEVQLQLFQRSFSTKSAMGRGIGTYSVKLFGERYLKGKVGFVSQEPDGTTFTFTITKNGTPL